MWCGPTHMRYCPLASLGGVLDFNGETAFMTAGSHGDRTTLVHELDGVAQDVANGQAHQPLHSSLALRRAGTTTTSTLQRGSALI